MRRRHSIRHAALGLWAAAFLATMALAQTPGQKTPQTVTVVEGPIQVQSPVPGLTEPVSPGTWESVELAAHSSGECPKKDLVKGVLYANGQLEIQEDGTLPCVDPNATEMYYRGVGRVPGCDGNTSKGFMGRCYEPCREGYEYITGRCYKPCPAGFRDVPPSNAPADAKKGLVCRKPEPYGRGAGFPWKLGDDVGSLDEARARCRKANPQGCEKSGEIIYPRCRDGYKAVGSNICSAKCPAGMTDTGVDCAKDSYTPVSRMADACFDTEEKIDGLCYKKCRTGFRHNRGSPGYVCSKGGVQR